MARQAEAHAHYAQGVLHELGKDSVEALEEFHKAAELDPGNEALVVEIARRWLLQKKPDRALEILKLGVAQPDGRCAEDNGQRARRTHRVRKWRQLGVRTPPRHHAHTHGLWDDESGGCHVLRAF